MTTRRPVVQLFYNDGSGRYSAGEIERLAQALRRCAAKVLITPSVAGCPDIATEATHLCVAGGDGTIRHVAATMAGCADARTVAIYPLGTVNLLARENGATRDPARVAATLLASDAGRNHYAVRVNADAWFFACASAGPDSLAVAGVSPRLKAGIGRLAYAVALLRLLVTWPRHQLRLRVAGETHSCEAVYIAKGRHYAGPWSFAPQASTDDGLLHVVALRQAGRREMLRFFWALARRQDPARLDNCLTLTCTALDLDGPDTMPLQGDGDILAALPVSLSVAPHAVRIC